MQRGLPLGESVGCILPGKNCCDLMPSHSCPVKCLKNKRTESLQQITPAVRNCGDIFVHTQDPSSHFQFCSDTSQGISGYHSNLHRTSYHDLGHDLLYPRTSLFTWDRNRKKALSYWGVSRGGHEDGEGSGGESFEEQLR